MMTILHQRIAREIPKTGHDVHVYNYESSGGVILFENGQISWQDHTANFEQAKRIGFDLMALHDCEMVEHHPYANRECE